MKLIGKQARQVAGMVLVTLMLAACTDSMDDLQKSLSLNPVSTAQASP